MKDYLADVLLPSDKGESVAFRVATISDNSPFEVDMAGATGLNASYVVPYTSAPGTAAIGDTVVLLQTDTDLIVFGKIVSGG